MNDLFDLFEKLLVILKLPVTTWTIILFLVLFLLRVRITNAINNLLDSLGKAFATEAGSRRFEPNYRTLIRSAHAHLKIVGIRTEEERRPEIADAYVPLKLLLKGESIDHAITVDQVLHNHMCTLVLGDPGAGKSTLLDYLIVEYTDLPQRKQSRSKLLPGVGLQQRNAVALCPIYIPLRRCLAKNKTLLDDIYDERTDILPKPVWEKMPRDFIKHCLKRKRALLLLDGLDEVANTEIYHSVVQKVNDFIQIYPQNKIVVTCRKAGWRGDLHPDFYVYSVLPLDSQQQHLFVHKWYTAVFNYTSYGIITPQDDFQGRADRQANALLTLLSTRERLRELASNPLILSLISLIHKQRKNLPRGRTALYQDCLDILLELWDRIDKELDQKYPTTEQKSLVLRRIAYYMHTNGAREMDRQDLEKLTLQFLPSIKSKDEASEIVRQIEVRSGLMSELSIDKLAFSHLTFQEFLVVDYLNNEQNGAVPLHTITGWSVWREPILLMCGTKSDPGSFLTELYSFQPLLAINGIAEADPTKLVIHTVQPMVDSTIEQVEKRTLPVKEAAPALVNLLSIEDNPFGNKVVQMLFDYIRVCTVEEASEVIETLSRSPSRETASCMLSLLGKPRMISIEETLLSGLARVGDAAIYEALAWQEQGKLSKMRLFDILVRCQTPLATKMLWEQYQLDPPRGWERTWAESWALRLADPENDALLRPLEVSGPGVSDPLVWPYRQNDKSAVASLIVRAFDILRPVYASATDIENNFDQFSQFALRLQIPLVVSLKDHYLLKPWVMRETKDFAPLPSNKEDWYALGTYLNLKNRDFFVTMFIVLGLFLMLVSALLADAGIIMLLPPDGNFFHFLIWLSLWAKISIPLTILGAGIGLYWLGNDGFDWDSENFVWITIITASFFFLPALFVYFIYIGIDNSENAFVVSKKLVSRRSGWKSIITLSSLLLGCGLISAADVIALLHWHLMQTSLLFSVPFLTIFVFIITILTVSMGVLSINKIADWLKEHPRGREVLDELKK